MSAATTDPDSLRWRHRSVFSMNPREEGEPPGTQNIDFGAIISEAAGRNRAIAVFRADTIECDGAIYHPRIDSIHAKVMRLVSGALVCSEDPACSVVAGPVDLEMWRSVEDDPWTIDDAGGDLLASTQWRWWDPFLLAGDAGPRNVWIRGGDRGIPMPPANLGLHSGRHGPQRCDPILMYSNLEDGSEFGLWSVSWHYEREDRP